MPHPALVRTGNRYGKLTVLELLSPQKARVRCDCGEEKSVWRINLTQGYTKSCGCARGIRTEKKGPECVLASAWK